MLTLRRHLAVLRTNWRYINNTKSVKWPITPKINNDLGEIIVEPLKNRELISVRGAEAKAFLQGLITNDMHQLDERKHFAAMYALFLNRGGRVLYDTIIYRAPKDDTYFIECDRAISSELRRYLRQYRVRRKIDINEVDTYDLWVAFSPERNIKINSLAKDDTLVVPDPRYEKLGTRLFRPKAEEWDNLSKFLNNEGIGIAVSAQEDCNYQVHRYKHGIAEGVEELPPSKCFPLEANADYLHGISFQKGCYVGQELTARTYHTGVVRKRLLPLHFSWPVTKIGEEILTNAGRKVGVVRGSCKNYGLGVLYFEKAFSASGLLIDGEPCSIIKPNWWSTPATEKKVSADA